MTPATKQNKTTKALAIPRQLCFADAALKIKQEQCSAVVKTGATGAIVLVNFENSLISPVDFQTVDCSTLVLHEMKGLVM